MTSNAPDKTKAKDYLTVDPEVPGQKFYCISFISPEKVLKTKTQFQLEHFWRWFSQQKVMKLEDVNIWEQFNIFLLKEEQKLEDAFHKENDFQTSIRGLKVRGVYETEEEARVRCQVLQRVDKTHSVFVAPVGYWVPWDPTPDGVGDSVYQEKQLNELMKQYNTNESQRDMYYEQQKRERTQAAMEENEKRKLANQKAADEDEDAGAGAGATDAPEEDTATTESVIERLEHAADHTDLKSEFLQFTTS